MAGAAALGPILSLAGAGVSAYGQNKADQQNYAKKKELEYFRDQLSPDVNALREKLLAGLSDGTYASAFAAPGMTEAENQANDAGFTTRALGSRTSARARSIAANRPGSLYLGRAGAEIGGEQQAAEMMSAIDFIIRAGNLPQSQFAQNQLAGYGNALQALGQNLNWESEPDAPLLDPTENPSMSYGDWSGAEGGDANYPAEDPNVPY